MHAALTRRRLITGALAGALTLVACGSDDGPGASGDEPLPTVPDTTVPDTTVPDTTVPRATDGVLLLPDEGAVIEVGQYGGFTLGRIAFQMAPQVLVTADGRLIEPAPVAEIYPGPLLPKHTVAPISEAGTLDLVEYLDEAGMLADLDMSSSQDLLVADAATATLVITTAEAEYRHEAYALGLAGPPGADEIDPNRIALAEAIDGLLEPRSIVQPGAIGEQEEWVPDAYQFFALPAGDLTVYEVTPTVVDWPADAGVSLADSTECVEISRAAVGSLFDDATELTFFAEDGLVYEVVARPAYPGRTC